MSSSLTAARVHLQIPYRRCLARGCRAAAQAFRLPVAIVATLSLVFQVAAQDPAFLVKNINTGVDPNASSLANLYRFETYSVGLAVNGSAYFAAYEREHGRELWKTDGTPEGTFLVADTNPGPADGLVSNPVVADGILFFTATDSEHGTELWRTDGTPRGTVLVKDINPEGDGLGSSLTVANGIVFFIGDDGRDRSLWRSDGTSAGTLPLAKMRWARLADVDGTLFALTTDSELWTSDGTRAGTVHVANVDSPGCYFQQFGVLAAGKDRVYFWGEELSGLWTSDGTPAGTVQLTDGCPDFEWITVDRITFFIVQDDVTGGELWRTDGTVEGTKLVKDINPGPPDAFFDEYNYFPPQFTAVGETLYFIATDGVSGFELWKSDGTEAGTVIVKDTVPGGQGISACTLSSEYDGTSDQMESRNFELWRSDGTPAGTKLLRDIVPGPRGSYPTGLAVAGGVVHFTTYDPYRTELWTSDGTEAGTILIKTFDSATYGHTGVGRDLFFLQDANPRRLWKSDGTASGTLPLADLAGFGGPYAAANGVVFFTDEQPWWNHKLWRTDGTPAETRVVFDFGDRIESLTLTSDGERLLLGVDRYSYRSDDPPPLALWRSDGTEAGTTFLQDISSAVDAPDGPYEDAPEFTRSGSHMFFTSGHDGFGRELWALPVSALLTPAPQQTATPTPPRSNSGGGCALDPTASSGWIALLVAAVLLVLRKAA